MTDREIKNARITGTTLGWEDHVARWANGFVWRSARFADYDRHRKNAPPESYDEQQGLFM